MPVVLSIAGSDSGGGAGIQADLKTFEAHGVFGTTAITGITAQNTVGVHAVHEVPPEIVTAQLDAVFDDFEVAAVKIGMLASSEIIVAIAEALSARAVMAPIVLDPVMVATSGDRLLRADAIGALVARLLPLATVVTPNSVEAAILADMDVTDLETMREAGRRIIGGGARAVLVKGGHIEASVGDAGAELIDVLLDGARVHHLPTRFIATASTHGTGCTLSSAIAARLAMGDRLLDAVLSAQAYVHRAIAAAPGLGAGSGPLLHRIPMQLGDASQSC